MTAENKELLLLIDLCARLPYKVKININGEEDTLLELGVDTGWVNASYDIEDVKPYLRPMSSMTKEESEEWFTALKEKNLAHCYDFVNSHYLDYRGLISEGLALEAKEGMYVQTGNN